MKTKHPGMPIPRTDRGRRSTEGPGGASTNNSLDGDHTQDYDITSPGAKTKPMPLKPTSKPSSTETVQAPSAAQSSVSASVADPKVYDFPDDDEEETTLDLPVKKTGGKSPIRSLSEMENRLFNSNMDKDKTKEEVKEAEEIKDDRQSEESNRESNQPHSPEKTASDTESFQAKEVSKPDEELITNKDSDSKGPVSEQGTVSDRPQSILSESTSQNSSKFSEFAQEHVSENFPMNSSEGTGTTVTTPVENQPSMSAEQPVEDNPDDEQLPENPIQGALDTTDDLDYHMNGDESDVLDDKMLRSPMSNISEDMRALDMPHVSTDSTSADLIQEADLAMSSPNKNKEQRDDDNTSGMPPEINAEVDALIESGLLDGHGAPPTTTKEQVGSHSSPRDTFHDVLAPPQSHVSSHAETPSAPPHYAGDTSSTSGVYSSLSTGGYTPSYDQPQSNPSHHTPEHDQRVPPAPASYPLPEYPPLPSPAAALQQLPISTSPPSYPNPLPPVYGLSDSLGAVVSSSYPASTVEPYRSPTTTSSATISSFAGSGLAPVVTTATSFLDAALTAGQSSLDLFPGSLPSVPPPVPSVSRPDTITTTSSSAVPSFSSSPFSTSAAASSAGRDLFGHYFPGAAPPDPMAGLSLPAPPTQDPQRPAYPSSSQAPGFGALQRSSADFLQRVSASALPTMNYPSVTESLARLNPSTTQSLWMPGTDERSRTWAQASPMLMPPELDAASSLSRNPLDAASSLSRNPFSSTRSEYNFEAALGKRPETSFPGVPVPQSVAGTEHRTYDPVGSYMGASPSHFGPGAAAAAAAANYVRGIPDYRSPAASATDMYGRHVGAPPLGLDKYYNPYTRDSMYRSSGLAAPPPPNPFMPPTTNTPYSANPMYQHGAAAAGSDAYSKYLPGSAEHRPADYFHQAAAPPRPPTADPYDPYRRSVIHNMMTRYY